MSTRSVAQRLNVGIQAVPPRWMYFAIFTVSGFSGLIYESIWSHYLKLFLGHAAFAQSLVLVIFMGGMAAGSWIASRFSDRWRSPLLVYAVVEVVIGLMALVFHDVFQAMIEAFYFSLLPGLDSPAIGSLLKWTAAALLIVPQSILLGMTFPLMSAGILRRYPTTPGASLATLYFTNSIGAAVGVIASGFWLIGLFGLPGTIFSAGLLNVGLALVVWVLIKLDPNPNAPALVSDATAAEKDHGLTALFLVAAFVTGAASFIYEIGWIRMLSLVLGSTTHSFELMLSAFITGLAFGGLWIKRRIDRIEDPVGFSAIVQILMGTAAMLTLPVYAMTFAWMESLLAALAPTSDGFTLFSLGSHGIALSVMLPTTFLAGMTLPLFTYVLMHRGAGEKAIGRVYAANTAGAIVGVVFAINVGLPALGLKNLIAFGAALDVALGVTLLVRSRARRRLPRTLAAAMVGIGTIVLILGGFDLDEHHLISGVYRSADLSHASDAQILALTDGRTSTISLTRFASDIVSISTNGKPDASIYVGDEGLHTGDETTMMMVGAIGLAYKLDAKVVGNIGMGSGLTAHTVLADPEIERVDTVEIEPKMVEIARGFGPKVTRAFDDPRSHIHFEDAKTFFSLHGREYDIIIAEPSNPWVSGVASLFSTEFYRTIRSHLAEDGLFVQWLQLYEFDDDLVFSVLKALSPHFSDYVIYSAGDFDAIVVAKRSGRLGDPDFRRLLRGDMAEQLRPLNLLNADDFLVRKTGEKASMEALFRYHSAPANSDYFPFVDLHAGQARFERRSVGLMGDLSIAPLPVLEMLHREELTFANVNSDLRFIRIQAVEVADTIYAELMDEPKDPQAAPLAKSIDMAVKSVGRMSEQCAGLVEESEWQRAWHDVAKATLPFLDADRASLLVSTMTNAECWSGTSETAVAWMAFYQAIAERDAVAMARGGLALLGAGAVIDDPQKRLYALTGAMLGLVESGHYAVATSVWKEYGTSARTADGVRPTHLVLLAEMAQIGRASTPVGLRDPYGGTHSRVSR